jgi:dTMP kinase
MNGQLIVVEGLDGVGKSTFAQSLAVALGAQHRSTPAPELRRVRPVIEDCLCHDRVARSLFYASTVLAEGSRAAAVLATGRDVVVDRYWLSTLVYAPAEAQEGLAAWEAFVRPADLTLYLHLPEAVRAARLFDRGLSPEDARTLGQSAVLDRRYRGLLGHPSVGEASLVDASEPVERLVERVLDQLRPRLAA